MTGRDGTFTVSDRWDGGKTVELDVPQGTLSITWTVTVTSADGNRTRAYRLTANRPSPFAGCLGEILYPGAPEYSRLGALTVTPAAGTLLSGPGTLAFKQRYYTVLVSSDTTEVTVAAAGAESGSTTFIMDPGRDRVLSQPMAIGDETNLSIAVRTDVGEKCYHSWHHLKIVRQTLRCRPK